MKLTSSMMTLSVPGQMVRFFSAILKPGPLHLNLPNKAYCITFVTLDHKTSHKVIIYLLRFIHNLVFINSIHNPIRGLTPP